MPAASLSGKPSMTQVQKAVPKSSSIDGVQFRQLKKCGEAFAASRCYSWRETMEHFLNFRDAALTARWLIPIK